MASIDSFMFRSVLAVIFKTWAMSRNSCSVSSTAAGLYLSMQARHICDPAETGAPHSTQRSAATAPTSYLPFQQVKKLFYVRVFLPVSHYCQPSNFSTRRSRLCARSIRWNTSWGVSPVSSYLFSFRAACVTVTPLRKTAFPLGAVSVSV